jgi:putative SOS response-associated peptidase YedK
MCGRMRPKMSPAIAEALGLKVVEWDFAVAPFDARPTDLFPVIRMRNGVREAVPMRWGLIPGWARGVPLKASTFNATIERMETAPTYRAAWRRGQRCIIPVSCFFEPHMTERRAKVTYRVWIRDREWFGLAGLWDESIGAGGEVITSCTIVTMPASPRMAEIHNEKKRQPVMLQAADHDAWLEGAPDEARAVLRPYPDDLIEAEPVIAGRFRGVEQPQDLFGPGD